jgi:hypothetical protein
MGFIQGEGRTQGTLFPVVLDDLVPVNCVCRIIDAFACRLAMNELGFERADPAETGRLGYDPRDLLKLYLYGYLQQIRSSRRLEDECRRIHREAVTEAAAELVRFALSVGLVRGEWVAIDGSKFLAVSNARSVDQREAVERYLDAVETADGQDEVVIDPSAVAEVLEKLNRHREPEARFMRVGQGHALAYNAHRGRCSTRADRGPEGHRGGNRQPQPVAHGRGRTGGRWQTALDERGRGRRLLQRRTRRGLREQGHPAACACQSRHQ